MVVSERKPFVLEKYRLFMQFIFLILSLSAEVEPFTDIHSNDYIDADRQFLLENKMK